ncbi:fumarylacetoacetate hydrolase family protein [Streptomyces sp. DSM 44915]|uniref:Fumarylacetoacetate hydrolase family protein n=1 Tax=Streptomyces chisholmiae TaxID=3075540 RepID=A0ABU2JXE5_9ACTN|nr:fumarylacetoacetate hydrolase family protein [Streptomyces sp. DSM 44915]MDT0269665.1 fumarylacetoacetate hydrolase family protein [Streptomyces sp. DSM 44915]
MSEWTIESTVDELLRRERERRDGGRITDRWPGLDLETAYRAQDALLERKKRAGERLVGVKLGLTSAAKQRRMGIDSPLTGWLTDAMVLPVGEPVRVGQLIHPRVEPEIVFTMGERLAGPGVTAERALAAVATVRAGFEVIDSRYRDFNFALPDVVADNASSCRFTVADLALAPDELDLVGEVCRLSVDGELVDTATGAAVQGHPAQALALAANDLARRGLAIEAGWTVLTGGLTDAVFVEPGRTISAEFTTLGRLALTGER